MFKKIYNFIKHIFIEMEEEIELEDKTLSAYKEQLKDLEESILTY